MLKTKYYENIKKTEEITRKDAIKKIGNYSKYAALTALGSYLILNPQKTQATSSPETPGTSFSI
ncbi:MAG: hypothetical protein QMC35_07995 [Polaribacter sp.]